MKKIKTVLRSGQITETGEKYIYLQLAFEAVKKRISTKISVHPDNWDGRKNIVLESDPDFRRKNKYLNKEIQRAASIIDKYYFDDKYLSADEFLRLFRMKGYSDGDFAEFVREQVGRKNLSDQSKHTYLTQITKLERFKKKIRFSDITHSFIRDYETFMVNKLKNNLNTVSKSLSMLRTFANWAKDYDLITTDPFKKVKIKKRIGNREFLTIPELHKFEILFAEGNLKTSQHNVLRYFLFSCYTGLRYPDIQNLKFGMLRKVEYEGKELYVLKVEQHKTKNIVSVPVIDKAQKLIGKNYGKYQSVFRVLSNQKTNQRLKDISKNAGIDKNITFHSARHTFATVAIEKGLPMEIISELLGHTELKTTKIYAKINDKVKMDWMKKFGKV